MSEGGLPPPRRNPFHRTAPRPAPEPEPATGRHDTVTRWLIGYLGLGLLTIPVLLIVSAALDSAAGAVAASALAPGWSLVWVAGAVGFARPRPGGPTGPARSGVGRLGELVAGLALLSAYGLLVLLVTLPPATHVIAARRAEWTLDFGSAPAGTLALARGLGGGAFWVSVAVSVVLVLATTVRARRERRGAAMPPAGGSDGTVSS